jgi:hypothetical protein
MSKEKLARWVPLAGAILLFSSVIALAQQARPFSAVYQRPFSQQGYSPGFGAGTALPTLANSNLAPQDAELFVLVTAPVTADPILQMYSGNASAWRPFLFSTLATNAIDVANSVWFASSSIVAEGATADGFELTIGFPDPGVDITYNIQDKATAVTGYFLDTGSDPAVTVEVPDREFAPSVTGAPRAKAWFRTAPTYATGAPAANTGAVAACSTTGSPNWLYGPAVTGYGFELDMKGTQTACGPDYAAADGMGLHADATTNEGFELTQGIVDGSPGAFTVGTSPAFYMSVRFAIATVANTDICGGGFRQVEAYHDTDMTAYDTYFGVFVGDYADGGAGDFYVYEELAGASAAATDLAETDWTDNQVHTIEVRVSDAGVATAYIEGVLVADAGTAFTFADTDIIVPYFWCQADVTGADPNVDIVFWESGIQ